MSLPSILLGKCYIQFIDQVRRDACLKQGILFGPMAPFLQCLCSVSVHDVCRESKKTFLGLSRLSPKILLDKVTV